MIETIASRAVARLIEAIAAQAADDLPDVAVAPGEEGVVLTGPGIALRRLHDGRLRGLAGSAARRER